MKDDLDMMFSRKENDIERISEKYPAAGRKEKEKIYKLSQQKYRQLKAAEESDDGFTVEASGVERYRRPMLYRGISAVAATMVLVSGLAGGLFLAKNSRIPKVDMSKSDNAGQATTVTGTSFRELDIGVDVLVDNFQHIMGELYTDEADYEEEPFLTFYRDTVDPSTGEMYKLTVDYRTVTDEKLNTPEKVKALMNATFAPKLNAYYLGNDVSGYENRTDFRDDGQASKYIRPFVLYKDMVLSDHIDDHELSLDYKFGEVYDFSGYEMISSLYTEDYEDFSGKFDLENTFSAYDESDMQSMVCNRVYKRSDGVLIYADFLLKNSDGGWKIANYSIMDESERMLEKSKNETEVQHTTAAESGDNAEFAELQMHDMTIFSNYEEAKELSTRLDYEMYDGTYPFRKVDTEKYTGQIMNASGEAALNSIENKSYIYHIMLNSYRYFDTADVVFEYRGEGDGGKWSNTEHCLADNRKNYFCMDNEFIHGTYHSNMTFYQDNNEWISVNNVDKTFNKQESDAPDYNYVYLPDNYRYLFYYDTETGQMEEYMNFTDIPMGSKCMDSLYPDTRYLTDFNDWHIISVEEQFDRDCAVIYVETEDYTNKMVVDLRSGIVLSYSEQNMIENSYKEMNTTSFKVDEPLEHRHFDTTGYKDDSYETPDEE